MNKKRMTGLFFISLGMILTLGDIRITGAFIGGSFFSWLGIVGLLSFVFGGVLTLDKRVLDPRSVLSGEKLKSRYRFMQSQRGSPDKESSWVTRYHAYPRERGEFQKGYIDTSKCPGGFYFSEDAEEAIEQVESRHLVSARDISVVKVKIAPGVYNGMVSTAYTPMGTAELIENKKIPKANRLIAKGLISIE